MSEDDVRTLVELKILARTELNRPVDLPRLRADGAYCAETLAALEARGSDDLARRVLKVRAMPMQQGMPAAPAPETERNKYRGSLR